MGFTLDPVEVAHRLKVLSSFHGGVLDVAWQAARVFACSPKRWQEETDWRTVYLSRYARIQPSEQEQVPVRKLWDWVRQTSKFLEMEAGKSRLVGDGEDR